MSIQVFKDPKELPSFKHKQSSSYKAMYSSLWDGIVLDPASMAVPIDDHIVHRGDGVFEAFRSHDRAIYDFHAHYDRLELSAAGLELPLPKARDEILEICKAMGQATDMANGTFRLYVSRGPGGFTTNPYETIGSQLYIVLTESGSYPKEQYENGVSVGISRLSSKAEPFCRIKSCNYLINVLMKKEAIDCGTDYMVCLDSEGFVTESSTENIALISQDNEFVAPPFQHMLKGTTLLRVMELAKENKKELGLSDVTQHPLTPDDFKNAKEAMMIGTTMGVLPVRSFEGQELGTQVSALSKKLLQLLKEDIASNENRREVF